MRKRSELLPNLTTYNSFMRDYKLVCVCVCVYAPVTAHNYRQRLTIGVKHRAASTF